MLQYCYSSTCLYLSGIGLCAYGNWAKTVVLGGEMDVWMSWFNCHTTPVQLEKEEGRDGGRNELLQYRRLQTGFSLPLQS